MDPGSDIHGHPVLLDRTVFLSTVSEGLFVVMQGTETGRTRFETARIRSNDRSNPPPQVLTRRLVAGR